MKRVVVSLLAEQQEFQRLQAEDAREAGVRTGIEVEVFFAENNTVRQIYHLLSCISAPEAERPAAIFIEPVSSEGVERVARSAAAAGIGWVSLSACPDYIAVLRREYPRLPISAITIDNEAVGEIEAAQFRTLLPSGGNVAYLAGPLVSGSSIARRRSMERTLQGSNIKVVKVLFANWTEEGGQSATAAWLANNPIPQQHWPHILGSQNDAMAVGARRALQAAAGQRPLPLFTGCDGLPDGGKRLVAEKVLAATILKPPQGGRAVEMIAEALRGKPTPASEVLAPVSIPALDVLKSQTRR